MKIDNVETPEQGNLTMKVGGRAASGMAAWKPQLMWPSGESQGNGGLGAGGNKYRYHEPCLEVQTYQKTRVNGGRRSNRDG